MNKINQHRKQFKDFLILCAVLLAVLFSSCSVRKTLHTQLNIPLTKSLNTSKATLTTISACKTVTEVNSLITHIKVKKDAGVPLTPSLSGPHHRIIATVKNLNRGLSNGKGSDQVPLYILYQNRKIIA